MADAVLTNSFRQQIASYMAGNATLFPIGYMAFGDQGYTYDSDSDEYDVVEPDADQTALNNEVLRKELGSIYQEDEYSVTGKCTIEATELVDVTLSEAALLDTQGNFIAIKNFLPKVKESDETYDVTIMVRF